MADPKLSRGYRNNNPGNIDRGSPWQGLAKPAEMTPAQRAEKRFAGFVHPKWGIRAIARVLITYEDKHGIDAIDGIIRRWAPKNENDTDAYIRAVDRMHPKARGTSLNMQDFADVEPLVKGIITHEIGGQPYPQAVIDEGLRLAGVVPKPRALMRTSPAVQGGTIAATGTAGATVMEILAEAKNWVGEAVFYVDVLKYVFVALIIAGVGYTLWTRLRQRKVTGQ